MNEQQKKIVENFHLIHLDLVSPQWERMEIYHVSKKLILVWNNFTHRRLLDRMRAHVIPFK